MDNHLMKLYVYFFFVSFTVSRCIGLDIFSVKMSRSHETQSDKEPYELK